LYSFDWKIPGILKEDLPHSTPHIIYKAVLYEDDSLLIISVSRTATSVLALVPKGVHFESPILILLLTSAEAAPSLHDHQER